MPVIPTAMEGCSNPCFMQSGKKLDYKSPWWGGKHTSRVARYVRVFSLALSIRIYTYFDKTRMISKGM